MATLVGVNHLQHHDGEETRNFGGASRLERMSSDGVVMDVRRAGNDGEVALLPFRVEEK